MNNLAQRIFDVDHLPKINDGQRELYKLICRKVKEKAIVQHKECLYIYKKFVQESEYYSRGYWDNDEWVENPIKYKDWEITVLCNSWLLRSLGSLIKKGYLTVIPRIDFGKLPEDTNDDERKKQ